MRLRVRLRGVMRRNDLSKDADGEWKLFVVRASDRGKYFHVNNCSCVCSLTLGVSRFARLLR